MKKFAALFIILIMALGASSQSQSGKYFVFLNTNPDRAKLPEDEVNKIQTAHMANMDSLAKARRLMAAGPFHGGGGMQILAATSIEDAQKLVDSDPAVKAGRFNTEVYPLAFGVGGICPVNEPYDMVEYRFVRFVPVKEMVDAESSKKLKKYIKRHVNYMKANFFKRRIIANGDFGEGLGGFMITFKPDDEDDFDTFLKYDPYIRSGLYTADTRILWVAEGTFCEVRKE